MLLAITIGTMSFKCGILSLIVLLNSPVSGALGETLRVTCSPQTLCALRESTVTLECSHSNTTIRPQHSFWFSPKQQAKWRNEEDPEDLALDSDYAGRVRYKNNRYRYSSILTLTISELRERDSGEYHLMIVTETGQKYSSSTAVTLKVSDLQMMMTSYNEPQTERTLLCSTSCSLSSQPARYSWYNNGKRVAWTNEPQRVFSLYRYPGPGSYSCSIEGHDQIRSNALCVFGKNCWNVTYSDRRLCALEGSSVDFPCTYSYPRDQTVTKTFWYYYWPQNGVTVDEHFAGRVDFLRDEERNCTLRIRNVRKSDSRKYHFQFITDPAEKFTGKPGVILNVTDLQVKVSPTIPSEGQTVTLTCISTCTLPNNPTYIWYKNRHPVTNKPTKYNKLYLESASTEDVLQYSCAIGALEGPVSPEAPKGSEAPEDAKENSVLKFITVASIFLALIFTTGLMWRWNMIRRKGGAESEARVQHLRDSPRDPDTALSPTTLSSDYDNLTHVRSSSVEMYSSLNPTMMVSDYDFLTVSLHSVFLRVLLVVVFGFVSFSNVLLFSRMLLALLITQCCETCIVVMRL
ncbi:uncharacterized protein LOC108443631 isoform X2 [Pygocentrus nattereri]|uniref:uncharacterized protein LOC108443631 isoform X2 n=1 Tax=Pygocentrus nattereri TaxID=42514 RepID=UPI0018911BC7|nr:uncharacterized protein LOC108443631 isoform X2 [Pygocentrus nattereri]